MAMIIDEQPRTGDLGKAAMWHAVLCGWVALKRLDKHQGGLLLLCDTHSGGYQRVVCVMSNYLSFEESVHGLIPVRNLIAMCTYHI